MSTYNSNCKSCSHLHPHFNCQVINWESGSINLSPNSNSYFGDMWVGSRPFSYQMQKACNCQFYVPSDNLEYFKWLYEQSQSAVQ